MLDQRDKEIHRVQSKSGFYKNNQCPLCKEEDHETFANINDWMTIENCNNCNYAYASHFPNVIKDVYDCDDQLDNAVEVYHSTREYRKNRFGIERVGIIKEFHKSGDILDIGCGTGWFLEVARAEGFNVTGQELSPQLAEFTHNNFEIPTYSCPVSEITDSFDVITMFDLIEHVQDPMQLLKDCKNRLNPNGIILAFTPNFDSYGITEMKEYSSLISPPGHLHYFTQDSINKICELSGMKVLYHETRGTDIADMAALLEFRGMVIEGKLLMSQFDSLQACIDEAKCGNHMRFICSP